MSDNPKCRTCSSDLVVKRRGNLTYVGCPKDCPSSRQVKKQSKGTPPSKPPAAAPPAAEPPKRKSILDDIV